MRRRSYLASLPALALGGCLSERSAGRLGATDTATPAPPDSIDADWPMPAADPGHSNHAAGSDGPTGPPGELWRVETDAGLSGPVVADGTLYVGADDGTVRSLDARTGDRRWQQSVGSAAGTPRVLDGRVHVPTADGVVALAAADGTEDWRVDTPSRAGVLLAGHGVYYVSEAGPELVALDHGSAERWRAGLADPWEPTLLAAGGHVLVSSGTHDSLPWVFTPGTGEHVGEREPRRGADFAAEQFALGSDVYAADAFFGTVRADAVEATGYGLRWRAGVDAYGGFAMAGGADRLYVSATNGDRPGLYALSLANGEVLWHTDAVVGVAGRPVVANEALLVRTDGDLVCLDPVDGGERWRRSGDGAERFIVVEDLVFATGDGTVRALRAP